VVGRSLKLGLGAAAEDLRGRQRKASSSPARARASVAGHHLVLEWTGRSVLATAGVSADMNPKARLEREYLDGEYVEANETSERG
jgi:hypothetical protein